MKKVLLCSTFILLVLSCHIKKDPKEVTELLTEYFTKASNETISIEERKEINQKALKLVLESDNKNDSLGLKNVFKIAKVYEYIGNYYKKQTPDSAYLYYTQAQKYYTLIKDKENIGKMLLLKASVQYYDGDLSRSEMFCLEALHHFNDVKGKSQGNLYDSYNLLGMLANDQQEYFKALEYHNKALQIILKDSSIKNRDILKSSTLNNLGVVYRNKDENRQALSYFAMALENKDLPEKIPHLYAMLLDNTAYSHFKLKEYTGVQDMFYNALLIRKNLNLTSGIVMSKLHMSEYYQEQKDINKAFQLAQEGYDLAKTKKIDPRDVMRLLKQLQQVNAPSKEAYAIEYNRIADSLQQATPRIHEAITQELAQAQELAKIKKKEQNQALLFWLGVVVVVSTLGSLVWHEKVKNKKREAEQKKESEQKEAQAQTVIKDKQTDIKVYDLLLSEQSKEKKGLITKQMSFIKTFYDSIFNRILGLRLFLETLKGKDSERYIHEFKKMEEELKTFYDRCHDMIRAQQKDDVHFVRLLHKLIKRQRKHMTVTDYTDVLWNNVDTVVKIQVYRIIEDCFHVINKTKKISLIELELFEEEENEVVILNLDCNGIVNSSALKDIASHTNEIGGKLKVTHEGGGTTKIEVALAIKSPNLMASLDLQHTS